jgi:AraC-like DNA-binding protein
MGLIKQTTYYRVLPENETVPMPISLRSVGHYVAPRNWQDRVKVKDFVQVFWGIEGEGEFIINGEKYLLKPGYVTYYRRMEEHHVQAVSAKWDYRWFTFDGIFADAFMESFKYPRAPFYVGVCPEELFERLEDDVRDLTPYGLKKAGATVYAALAAMGITGEDRKTDLLVQQIRDFIEENYGNETINVNSIASVLGVHRSTISRKFQSKMQMSPGMYLYRIRVQKALSMLRTSVLPASEVGRCCGISDPCYFSKVIKKITGLTPGKFRKQ